MEDKIVYFACNDWHPSPDESYNICYNYLGSYASVDRDKVVNKTIETGYTTTLFNRRRYIPEILNSNYNIQEFGKRTAMNAPIQGTAADVMKLAMVRLQNDFEQNNIKSKIIIQVHDELVIETVNTEKEQVKLLTKQAMELNQPFLVPLKIDIAESKSWMEI